MQASRSPPTKFFRVGDPPLVIIPGREDVIPGPDAEHLKAFAQVVREKECWYRKVLEQNGLVEKWVAEAQLPEHPDVLGLVRELKSEARRICIIDHTVRLNSPSLPSRAIDVDAIHTGVRKADRYLRASKYGIDKPGLYEDVGAYFTDDVVPQELHRELVRELDALAAIEPRDFHPGTGCKVQDLIHPSLYPLTAGMTPLPDDVKLPPAEDGVFATRMKDTAWMDNDISLTSAYAWIPTVFAVSADGTDVAIKGYINGLGSRKEFPSLYALIEQTFLVAMPMLERTTQFKRLSRYDSSSFRRFQERRSYYQGDSHITLASWKDICDRQEQEKRAEEQQLAVAREKEALDKQAEKDQFSNNETDAPGAPSIWAGQKLKVVVKAANYILEPGQEYSGTWHIEGMPHERIVASAIYYYERDDSIVDAGLYLSRKHDKGEWPSQNEHRDNFTFQAERAEEDSDSDDEDYEAEYEDIDDAPSEYGPDPSMGDLPSFRNVGIVPTTNETGKHGTGRIVSFPNWVQHRVVSVYNDPAASSVAVRKILCFFVIDDSDDSDTLRYPGFTYENMDNMKVLTSCDVPKQARACNLPTLKLLLCSACRQAVNGRQALPMEVEDIILSEAMRDGGLGMSREEAERRRRMLMEDRRVQTKNVNGLWATEFSLCEH